MAQTFLSIPTTGVYTSADGTSLYFVAGSLMPMDLCYYMRVPGATAPAAIEPLNVASEAYIAAADVVAVAAATAAAVAADAVIQAAGINGLLSAQARTATSDGLTTGIVSDSTDFVTVTSADANNIIALPTPTPGRIVTLRNGATGYELRSSAPATVAINGGAGSAAESAIGANVSTVCRCTTSTAWICTNYSTAGTVSATEVAAP